LSPGTYDDATGNYHGLLLTGSGINWKPRTVPLPANAGAIPNVQLPAVACHSTTSCAATGWYRDSSGSYQGLIVTHSGTSWHATEAPLPADAGPTPNAQLRPVACPAATWCIAAGEYASLGEALLETGVPS
jgi:hypothetical protein